MKLFYANLSPYARKVRVLILEKQLEGIAQEAVNPFDLPPALLAINPLSKVPALQINANSVLYDSPVICEYLDSLGTTDRLLPTTGEARWTQLRQQALADGLMDTTFCLALEFNRRPEHQRSPDWIDRWCATLRRTTAALESEILAFPPTLTLAHIATGCALGYLDLRAANLVNWRPTCPNLASWYEGFAQRPAMLVTQPEP